MYRPHLAPLSLALLSLGLLWAPACAAPGPIGIDESSDGGDGDPGDGDGDPGDGDPGDGDGDPGDGDGAPGDGDGDGDELLQRWEIRMPDFSPPAAYPTFYSCYSVTLPVASDIHIVGFEPKITDPHVHHIVAQIMPAPQVDDPGDLCVEDPWDDMMWGWAPGGEALMLPPAAGFRAGQAGTVTVRFQVHYDNPLHHSFVDSGGFDVLYTEQLRPNDAAFATFGDIGPIYIPANDPAHEHIANCGSTFTQSKFGGPLTVIGTWLHAHNRGAVLWGEVVPGNGDPAFELGRADPYLFDYQTVTPVPDNTVMMPGDQIRTHCVYDNSGNPSPVVGGVETADEMCINFVLYYPKSDLFDECGIL